jgi:hypothetical protein
MRTATRIVLVLLAGLLPACVTLPAPAASGGAVWGHDFEGQLPGTVPKGWQPAWGVRGDDLLVVSNLRAVSGSRSLLLDRWSGTEATHWGAHAQMPAVRDGWAVLSWAFLVQGAGSDAWFGFEIQGSVPNERIVNVGVFDGIVQFQSGDWKRRELLGRYEEDTWYRVVLRLPTPGGRQTSARGRLLRRDRDGSWLPVGEEIEMPASPPRERLHSFRLITSPGKRGYLLFLDDVRLERAPDG